MNAFIRPSVATFARCRRIHTSFPRFAIPPPNPTAPSSSPSSSLPDSPVPPRPLSSCPPGTPLIGLTYLRDQPPPVALPDTDYPPWLWTLLPDPKPAPAWGKKAKKVGRKEEDEGDWRERMTVEERRRQVRKVRKERIRNQNFMKTQ